MKLWKASLNQILLQNIIGFRLLLEYTLPAAYQNFVKAKM